MAADGAAGAAETPRDRHLFGPGPKRILALDGGGVRGALTVAFLARIEALLDAHYGHPVRLGDYFDLIGGTSTGALIAAGLALGLRVEAIRTFYLEHAALAFRQRRWQVPLLQSKFDARGLREQIASVIGERPLDTPDLITGFCLVAKRMDTGSAWIISNDPRAPYWEDGPGHIGNRHYPLANLVRASTAAPHYFDPSCCRSCRTTPRAPCRASFPAMGCSSMAACRPTTTRAWRCCNWQASRPSASTGRLAPTGSA